jgi:hypothetical protein
MTTAFVSEAVRDQLTTEEVVEFAEFHLANMRIEFVPKSWSGLNGTVKAVYTVIRNDGRIMIVWHLQNKKGRCVYVAWEKDCPCPDELCYEEEIKVGGGS